MSDVIKNKYDFVVLFDVKNGNPNGDPDAGNMPRVDPETGLGLVTDVCLKRKIRNYVGMVKGEEIGYQIYIRENVSLEDSNLKAVEYLGVKDLKSIKENVLEPDKKIMDFMCSNFFDIRTFGAVMTTFTQREVGLNCGQVRGPVQFGFAHSIDPVNPRPITITRVTYANEKNKEDRTGNMGNKYIVPYGLYRVEGHVSANLAQKTTGFSEDDLQLLWQAIINMFEDDHSAARGEMAVRKLIVFKHESKLGNAPAYKLFERVKVQKKEENQVPRAYEDYVVTVDADNLPQGVICEQKI